MKISWILPVHNEAAGIRKSVGELADYCGRTVGCESRYLLVENGSRDSSWMEIRRLEEDYRARGMDLRAFQEPNAGIGYAFHRGMSEALAAEPAALDAEHWILLTAADLPFGFTDLNRFLMRCAGPDVRIACGSKAHPESRIQTSPLRQAMSFTFWGIRRILLGMKVGDSQGTFWIRADLAREILPRIQARDFFFTTELSYYAESLGHRIVEVPVVLKPNDRPSTVRPLRDGWRMFKKTCALMARDRF